MQCVVSELLPATDSTPTRAGAAPRQSVLERAPGRTLASGIRVVAGLLRPTAPSEHSGGTLFLDTATGNAGRVGPGGAAAAGSHVVSGGGVVLGDWQVSDGETALPSQGHFSGAETSVSTQRVLLVDGGVYLQ